MNISKQKKRKYPMNKKVKFSGANNQKHWVGDGFFVHNLLQPVPDLNPYISPFLLLDYASPMTFEKSTKPKGVGEHPHRGFETVTFAYQGEVSHKDSAGGGGTIKEGDVQWMTAGSGVVHEEFHSEEFTKSGGTFEMVQLWVNLPANKKMIDPSYQGISKEEIPIITVGDHSQLRVIAGEYKETKGPASTHSEVNVFDVESSDDTISIPLKGGNNTIMLVMKGTAKIENKEYKEKEVIIFEQQGDALEFATSAGFKALILNGSPINEPVVAHGPFVMNTKEEITQAISDYQSGNFVK
jgi:redox-sensitive bicupin YhaK (pirin superfamily)